MVKYLAFPRCLGGIKTFAAPYSSVLTFAGRNGFLHPPKAIHPGRGLVGWYDPPRCFSPDGARASRKKRACRAGREEEDGNKM